MITDVISKKLASMLGNLIAFLFSKSLILLLPFLGVFMNCQYISFSTKGKLHPLQPPNLTN